MVHPDCNFHSSIASFASERSYHQNFFISTVADVYCVCGVRKKSPRTSSLVQLSIATGLSTGPGGVMVERSLRVRKVAGSIPSRDIPKVVKRWYK